MAPAKAQGSFVLVDPASGVYDRYALAAGGEIKVGEETMIAGNVHGNEDVELKPGSLVDGDVSAVGELKADGSVTGSITADAPALQLPAMPSLEALRALADRVFENDTAFEDAVIDDVVFVDGKIEVRGVLGGSGTLIASDDIKLEAGAMATVSDRLSLISLSKIEVKRRALRCVLYAADDVKLDQDSTLEGVIVAGGKLEVKKNVSVTFESPDTTPPTIDLQRPVDGLLTDNSRVEVVGRASDGSGVVEVLVNGIPALRAGDVFTADLALDEGANAVRIEAVDATGNRATVERTVTFRSDIEPPSLTIRSPAAGTFVIESRPRLEVTFDDDAIEPASLSFVVAGVPLSATCEVDAAGAVCDPAADLADGPVTLEARIADRAGNIASDAVGFVVDTAGVEVTVVSPADRVITRDATVTVDGTVGPGIVSVVVNGVAATLDGGGFSAVVPLREGTNMVVALARKSNGLTGADTVEVTRDLTAPRVRIATPAAGRPAVEGRVVVTGQVNDVVDGGLPIAVRVNGLTAEVANGSFTAQGVPLIRGPNVIEAIATDAVGNVGRHRIDVDFVSPAGGRIGARSGSSQLATVGEALPQPLVARVSDEVGNPLAGRLVRFEVKRNSGLLRAAGQSVGVRTLQVATDPRGEAVAFFTLGAVAGQGSDAVIATALGVAGEAVFSATALPGPPARVLMRDGANQRGAVGQSLAAPFEALVVDAFGNPLPGVEVTFAVRAGAGSLDGTPQLARVTDSHGVARALLTLGNQPGRNNNVVDAAVDGLSGLPATFFASGLLPGDPAATAVVGVVLDNGLTPIPGATVTETGSGRATVTDDAGRFRLAGVPPGHIHLAIDPATGPRPETFPPLAFELVAVAGQDNTLGMPILIPAMRPAGGTFIDGSQDVTLTMEGVEGLTLTVFAGSATFPDGSTSGTLSIDQVHLDKVPMPPPNGTFFMPPAWTIQPAGVTFDPPARITIPNDALPPGRIIDIVQFDHALNDFIFVGKGAVTEDATVIVSDDGFGITRSGWGGCVPPPPEPTCLSGCDDNLFCNGEETCVDGKCQPGTDKPDGTVCDDMDECTVDDECLAGRCEGTEIEVEIIAAPAVLCVGSMDEVEGKITPPGRTIHWTTLASAVLAVSGSGPVATVTGVGRGTGLVRAEDATAGCASDARLIEVLQHPESFEGPTDRRACLFASNGAFIRACLDALLLRRPVLDWVQATFGPSDPSCMRPEGAADAAQHAVWACEMFSDPDIKPFAQEILDLHENSENPNNPPDPCKDHEMDFNNNQQGAMNAGTGGDCRAEALADLASGRLQINNPPNPGISCP